MIFHIQNCTDGTVVIQDPTHVATKLRNRLLKPGISLPFGKFHVSIRHLKSLVKNVHKRGLSMSDITPKDKMDYDSFDKITHESVIGALEKVKSSEATVLYLKISREATSSYLELDLSPLERIYRIWHALYVFRIWRQHIKNSSKLRVIDNLISPNSFKCIEINAETMTLLIKKFRDNNTPEQFRLPIFDSQTCERIFRQLRSMGSMTYTKINFSMYEVIHMIGRLEVANDIAYNKLNNEQILFPNKRSGKTKIYSLPNDEEIAQKIAEAKRDAIKDTTDLGINNLYEIENSDLGTTNIEAESDDDIDDDLDTDSNEDANEDSYEDENIHENCSMEEENREDDTEQCEDVDLNIGSSYTTVLDEKGIKRIVRKSTLVWMNIDPTVPLSKDRLKRFISVKRKSEPVAKKLKPKEKQ